MPTRRILMTKFRHLVWVVIAAVGLILSVSPSFAQKPDVGDQPGLLPDDSVELDPEFRKQVVYYRTNEALGRGDDDGAGQRPRHPLWHRRRPRGISVAGAAQH